MEQVGAKEIAREANVGSHSLPHAHARALRILLVEDHADTAAALVYLLRRWGHSVTHAGDVTSALAAAGGAGASAGEQAFDLVISDIGLPDGSGLEVMRRLAREDKNGHGRKRESQLHGIAISGRAMDEDLEKSRSAGFAEHLIKPISIEHLRAAIGRATAVMAKAG